MKFTKTDRMKHDVHHEVFDKVFDELIEQIFLGVHNTVHEHVVVQIWWMYHKIYWGTRYDIF